MPFRPAVALILALFALPACPTCSAATWWCNATSPFICGGGPVRGRASRLNSTAFVHPERRMSLATGAFICRRSRREAPTRSRFPPPIPSTSPTFWSAISGLPLGNRIWSYRSSASQATQPSTTALKKSATRRIPRSGCCISRRSLRTILLTTSIAVGRSARRRPPQPFRQRPISSGVRSPKRNTFRWV